MRSPVSYTHLLALGEDVPNRAGVVLGVNPIADVEAITVELGTDTEQDVRNLTRDELLDVLARAVVVRAVADLSLIHI